MQLVVLDPSAPPRPSALAPIHPDATDAGTLAWLDLDRSEVAELARMLPELPASVARDLADPTSVPGLRERGALRWLSLLAVTKASGGHDLGDLDVLYEPGLLVTVHSGERAAIDDLRDPARWRRRLAPPLSRSALATLIRATLDGYDDLIDQTEVDIARMHDRSVSHDRRAVRSQLLHHRRRMMAVRGQLNAQRDLFADLARSDTKNPPDGSWWINDRLDAAIAGAREAADYALAGTLDLHEASHRRGRELVLALVAAWSTWLGLLVITRAIDGGKVPIEPFVLAAVALVVLTIGAIAAAVRRRWQ